MTADAFTALFDEHADAIFGFCFRRTADHALAEDLTATVFLEAWRRREQVDLATRPALPWLYGVAGNVLRNARRSLRRHREVLERIPPAPERDRVAEQAEMRELLEAVAGLPRHEREVVELVAWADLSYADAAEALGVPVGTVRSRLSRARARLGVELLPVPQEVL
jgi:RNA polymerase sigma-70 factor (ECF subfamily)